MLRFSSISFFVLFLSLIACESHNNPWSDEQKISQQEMITLLHKFVESDDAAQKFKLCTKIVLTDRDHRFEKLMAQEVPQLSQEPHWIVKEAKHFCQKVHNSMTL